MKDMVQVRRQGGQSYKGPDAKIGRSQFDRSHGLKTTFDASYLYPILLDEVLPGDTFTCSVNGFARIFSPLLSPVMDNIELEILWFYCPTRLLWDNWVSMQGEHVSAGAQDTDYTIPVVASGLTVDHDNVVTGHGLAAHLGLPHGLTSAGTPTISALPFRMYNFLYNEWFRDQNLKDVIQHRMTDSGDVVADWAVQKSNKKHDYFTGALPYLQKGDPVTVDALGTAPIWSDSVAGGTPAIWSTADSAWRKVDADGAVIDMSTTLGFVTERWYANFTEGLVTVNINALRESVAIQRLLETDARGGTRYVESIKAHFGVTSPDFRLQRPEYLGGGKSYINISPVANTSGTATEDQAELRGVGTGVIRGSGFSKSFTEHGYVMGLMRARADITYFQGIDKLWTRSTRYDFYIPALANLGEQAVLNQEIFASNVPATDIAVFGYQERWAEYRTKPSRVVGVFNPDVTGALSQWHLAEDFSSLPALNANFVKDATPMNRVTTVTTEPDFLADLWFTYKCARPIPVRSVPSLIGRF